MAAAWKNEIALLGLLVFAFLGFGLICVGVFYMFYVEPRLKDRG